MIVYVDMDGVISDFDGEKAKWKGSYNKFFQHMIDTHGFASLEMLPCNKLMNRLQEIREVHGAEIKILSSYGILPFLFLSYLLSLEIQSLLF